ncbi:unnamed protein product [Lactuca virosa]|uniref:Uncharacterized protein n=1 Tax=Lactuca virosa TaxID=75947 RepID=A0AAU9N946_9ASTR|nr:unnamed protein product [Lactuca virosa]
MSEVDEESKQISYTVVRDENGNVKLDCPAIEKQFAAEEISAQVLRKLVDDASKFMNDKVTKVVVTVPAYFNDSQRTATKDSVSAYLVDSMDDIGEKESTKRLQGPMDVDRLQAKEASPGSTRLKQRSEACHRYQRRGAEDDAISCGVHEEQR